MQLDDRSEWDFSPEAISDRMQCAPIINFRKTGHRVHGQHVFNGQCWMAVSQCQVSLQHRWPRFVAPYYFIEKLLYLLQNFKVNFWSKYFFFFFFFFFFTIWVSDLNKCVSEYLEWAKWLECVSDVSESERIIYLTTKSTKHQVIIIH